MNLQSLNLLRLPIGILIVVALARVELQAQAKRRFTGTITDSMCATADHSRMRMGPTDGECTTACVGEHGALYVLYDGKQAWTLSDQKTPEKFAGKKVTVTGTPDPKAMTIQVASITAAK
jgi:hypothetical protein